MTQAKRKNAALIRGAIIIGLLALWELAAQLGKINIFYTSHPSEIARDLIEFATSGALAKHSAVTLQEAFLGLLYGSVMGVAVGVLFGQFAMLGQIFKPIITAIYGIPQLTLAPVYILWFGLGLTSKVFLAALMTFFNVFFATYGAIQDMDMRIIESASLLGANKRQTLWHIVLPTCSPWIISGVRSGIGSSLIGAIVGEYMGASAGFGWMVAYATSYFNIKRVMSCIVILLIVGLVLNYVLDKIEQRVLRWRPKISLSMGQSK